MPTEVTFKLSEPKKHSGKYVQSDTQNQQYPNYMYFRKEWFPNSQLPQRIKMTVEPVE